jgi:dolichol-phosphate mannosyltransferase
MTADKFRNVSLDELTRRIGPQALLSIVVPLYNEELVIDELYTRLTKVISELRIRCEVVMVNDGSRDGTHFKARQICLRDERFKLISFSRNFGHQLAVTAGMDRASGDAVVIIDADLQDPPEVILEMLEKWREGNDVVYGVRTKREGEGFFKRATASLFYRILRRATNVDIPVDTGDFRLMDRRVVDQLLGMRERFRFVRGMVSWVGFKQCKVEYVRAQRFAGETKYPFHKMLRFAIDGMLSFSHVPLKLSSTMGLGASVLSFLFMIYGVVIKVFFPERAISGWASLFVAVLFLGGVQLICIGIIGEYIGRMYDEVKRRPLYISEEEINFDTARSRVSVSQV